MSLVSFLKYCRIVVKSILSVCYHQFNQTISRRLTLTRFHILRRAYHCRCSRQQQIKCPSSWKSLSHYGSVTWVSSCLGSLAHWPFVKQFIQISIKDNSSTSLYFCDGESISRDCWQVVPLSNGPVMWKLVLCHDLIMNFLLLLFFNYEYIQ